MAQENYKNLRFFLKLIFSIMLGISISFVITQNNKDFRQYVQEKISASLQNSLVGCKVECQVGEINLFVPKIELDFLRVRPNKLGSSKLANSKKELDSNRKVFIDKAWKAFDLDCKKVEIGFSWIDFILGGVIDIYVDVKDLKLESLLVKDGLQKFQLSIWPHIMAFFSGSSIEVPILMQSFSVKKGKISIRELEDDHKIVVNFSSITKNISGNYKTKISFFDGDLSVYSKKLFDKLSGSVGFDIFQRAQNLCFYLDGKCALDLQFLNGNKTCFVGGKWVYDQGFFEVTSQDKTLTFSNVKFYFEDKNLYIDFGFESALGDLTDLILSKPVDLSGKCFGDVCLEFGSFGFGCSGAIKLENLKYKDIEICSLVGLEFKNNEADHSGSLSVMRSDGLAFNGNFDYNINKNNFSCDFVSESEVKLPLLKNWKILPKKAKFSVANYVNKGAIASNGSGELEGSKQLDGFIGSCSFCANNKTINSNLNVSGDIRFLDNIFSINGKVDGKKYELSVCVSPVINLKKLVYCNGSGEPVISIKSLKNDDSKFNGLVKFSLLKSLIKDYLGYDFQGEGDFKFYGMRKKDLFLLELNLKNGSVSFPNIYNFLNNFKITCKIDPYKKIFVAKNSTINFHKGCITSKKAIIKFDDEFNPIYIYAPFIFNNCFINFKNDLFSLVSGRMLLYKEKNKCLGLKGLTIIERSHLKKNIFSQDERRKYFKDSDVSKKNCFSDCDCDISVITKEPVKINTDFINTSANLDLVIKNKLFDPQLSGKIDFVSGTLAFPYKPLNITKGSIYFIQHQTSDPIIELTASNKINKYNVSMYISGSMQNYNISFESSPPLSEEQIIALLIAGSAQESLNVVAPALIVQSLKDSLFGSGESKFLGQNYIEKILKPFKNVRIMPSFVDQTGRGGLRGTIEVDINERTRASVEKNFSLSEDTRFELEYLLADDVSARGVRRENGNIGGEVEMRWKF